MSDIEQQIKRKIEAVGKPLKDWDIQINYGIKTGYNEAFIIDSAKRDELIKKCAKSVDIIRPILRGRDIKRYSSEWAGKYIINTHTGYKSQSGKIIPPINIEEYPAIKEHLDQYYPQLAARQDKGITPYHLRSCIYMEDLIKPKIIWLELTDHPTFAIDLNNYFLNNTIFFFTGNKLEYLTGFLNSRICEWYFDKIAATSGVGTRRWIKQYIDKLFVPEPTLEMEKYVARFVNELMQNKKINNLKKLDLYFYDIFELTSEEMLLIETANL